MNIINQDQLKEVIKLAIKEAMKEVIFKEAKVPMEISDPKEIKVNLTILECAQYTGIGKDKLMELAHSTNSGFPCFKVGKKSLINKELLNRWLEKISVEGRTL